MSDQPEWPRYIAKMQRYLDDQGREVVQRKVVYGTAPKDFVEFTSHGSGTAQTNQGQIGVKFVIPLAGAKTVPEAFKRIKECEKEAADKALEEVRRQIEEQQRQQREGIWVPGMPGDPPGPGGSPPSADLQGLAG